MRNEAFRKHSVNSPFFIGFVYFVYIPMTWNEVTFEAKPGFSKDSASSSVGRSLGFVVECQIFLLTFPICYSSLEYLELVPSVLIAAWDQGIPRKIRRMILWM